MRVMNGRKYGRFAVSPPQGAWNGGSGGWGNPFGVIVVLIEIWSETCYGERFDRSQNEAIDIVNVLGNISK